MCKPNWPETSSHNTDPAPADKYAEHAPCECLAAKTLKHPWPQLRPNPSLAPIWPPPDGGYDYFLELNDSEVAWEFLRRNLNYQQTVSEHQEALSRPRAMASGQHVWFDGQRTMAANRWGLSRFVDPASRAPEAPIDWKEDLGAAKIDAVARDPHQGERPDVSLAELQCVRHIVVSAAGGETLLINTSDKALSLRLSGTTALRGPVCLTFQIAGMNALPGAGRALQSLPDLLTGRPRKPNRSRRRMLLREALIALDGRAAGATYQDVAVVIAGAEVARAAWKNADPLLKDRMRRALKAGMLLRNGRYRLLIEQK